MGWNQLGKYPVRGTCPSIKSGDPLRDVDAIFFSAKEWGQLQSRGCTALSCWSGLIELLGVGNVWHDFTSKSGRALCIRTYRLPSQWGATTHGCLAEVQTVLTCVLSLGKVQECAMSIPRMQESVLLQKLLVRLGQTGLRIDSSFTGGLAILFPCGAMHTTLHRHEGVQTPLAARLSVENAVALCWICKGNAIKPPLIYPKSLGLGHWQLYDQNTGFVIGHDVISCVIMQNQGEKCHMLCLPSLPLPIHVYVFSW